MSSSDGQDGQQKLITFAVPCYNAAAYMDNCLQSLIEGSKDHLEQIEIIIVDDGSDADDTAKIAFAWQQQYPSIIKVISQANGGHGEAVNTGLANASGLYFKVVDADDWLDTQALALVLTRLKWLAASSLDMMVTNYVYDKADTNKKRSIKYGSVMPEGRVFTWEDVGAFKPQQNLLMHAVIYRTQLLKGINIKLPKHTFYVDNIFVYVPLPSVQSLYYIDIDLYHYFIGREGQSVNESTMIKRIGQQLKITRIMIDAFQLMEDVQSRSLRRYMIHYLNMMMTICSVFLRLSDLEDAEEQRLAIWAHLKEHDPRVYAKIRGSVRGIAGNLPGGVGKAIATGGYRIAQKIFKFN